MRGGKGSYEDEDQPVELALAVLALRFLLELASGVQVEEAAACHVFDIEVVAAAHVVVGTTATAPPVSAPQDGSSVQICACKVSIWPAKSQQTWKRDAPQSRPPSRRG